MTKKGWEWVSPSNGIGEVKISSWKEFPRFVAEDMLEYDAYIWRGHKCDNWELESTLDRLVKKMNVTKADQYEFRRSHLEQFKFAARGRRGPNPTRLDNDNDWWALGQHHGLATPLLDWTSSPFVSAYFAYIEKGLPQTQSRAIYALHKPSIEKIVSDKVRSQNLAQALRKKEDANKPKNNLLAQLAPYPPIIPEVEFIRPFSDENQRLVNQGGLFTRAQDGVSLDEWVNKSCDQKNENFLIKIILPNDDREEALTTLNRMNINHLTLFPDLYGASKFCNLYREIKRY